MNWFDMYGSRNGFIIHLLRYFLLMNWGRNLHLTENEYLALVAMVMGRQKLHESYYQTIVLKPTARCVSIGNWFMVGIFENIKQKQNVVLKFQFH